MGIEEQGFKTGKILLPGLDLIVNLHPYQYHRDDGEVDDMKEHMNSVIEDFSLGNSLNKPEPGSIRNAKSQLMSFSIGTNSYTIVSYHKDLPREQLIGAQGETEMGVIVQHRLEGDLLRELRLMGAKTDPFLLFKDQQLLEIFGGALAMYRHMVKDGERYSPEWQRHVADFGKTYLA